MTLRRYHVRRVYEAQFHLITARSASAAISQWARIYDWISKDDPILNGVERPVVIVTTENGSSLGEWIVEGGVVPTYRVRRAPRTTKGETV